MLTRRKFRICLVYSSIGEQSLAAEGYIAFMNKKNPNNRWDLIFGRREREYFMIPDEAASDHQIMRLRCAASFSFFINFLIKPPACCGISSK